jgi:death-on-curing protein
VISINDAIAIHDVLIESFGGSKGIRDKFALQSALTRPFQTFEEGDLYPNPEDKAAALLESIIVNHPFLDGNKRIGYTLMRLILLQYEMDIRSTQAEKFEMVMSVAKGEMKFEQIRTWIKSNLKGNAP